MECVASIDAILMKPDAAACHAGELQQMFREIDVTAHSNMFCVFVLQPTSIFTFGYQYTHLVTVMYTLLVVLFESALNCCECCGVYQNLFPACKMCDWDFTSHFVHWILKYLNIAPISSWSLFNKRTFYSTILHWVLCESFGLFYELLPIIL